MKRKCWDCKEEKPMEEFYVSKREALGKGRACKECVKQRVHRWRQENKEKVRAYKTSDKVRAQKRNRRAAKMLEDAGYRAHVKGYYERYRKNNRERIMGRVSPHRVVCKERVCVTCGFDAAFVQVHHVDGNHKNNNPQNLRPLCPNCHWAIHYNKK